MSMLLSLLVLSLLIFFHELGHYLAARSVGVYVEVFSIGFGKKLFSFQAFNTEWSISAIPLGGYVKMKGQDDSDPSKQNFDEDSYTVKTPLQRIFILLSGPLANFLVAFILYFGIALSNPPALLPIIGDVTKESPAQVAGIKKGDKIVEINGIAIHSWREMAELINKADGKLTLRIQRDGFLEYKTITPKLTLTKNIYGEEIQRKMIGIAAAGETFAQELSFTESLTFAFEKTVDAATMIFTGLQKLIIGDVPASQMGGVISIVKITSDAAQVGLMSVAFFTALISVNLGVLNLLPIPALDGGHIMFNLYELITKKAPSQEIFMRLTVAGWALLFSLMALGLYNDITRLLG